VSDPLDALTVGDASSLAVLVDYDGSIAPIVDAPEDAVALPAARDALAALVGRVGLVGVVSGRPVSFLRERVALDGVRYVGQYGLEWLDAGGQAHHDERATPYLDAVAAVADEAQRRFPGVWIERKGRLAVTLHWRVRPELGEEATRWADDAGRRYGLTVYPTRMARELRPPVPVDKGTAVAGLVHDVPAIERACFAGDDHGDLAAFAALEQLRADGALRTTARIVVHSAESPPELLDAADVVVDGPDGLAALLTRLAASLR
jgi:trehalose 6-phosphate phosphatase